MWHIRVLCSNKNCASVTGKTCCVSLSCDHKLTWYSWMCLGYIIWCNSIAWTFINRNISWTFLVTVVYLKLNVSSKGNIYWTLEVYQSYYSKYPQDMFWLRNKLEDLRVLRGSPDLFNNINKRGQGQLRLIIKHISFYHKWGLQPFWSSDLKQSNEYSIKQPSDFW